MEFANKIIDRMNVYLPMLKLCISNFLNLFTPFYISNADFV
jgi:hypothetical protein